MLMDDLLPPRLRHIIAAVDTDLHAIASEHPASMDAEPAPNIVYHYTDDAGLRGIIESGTLWYTDVSYLNDPSEFKYGVSIATNVLERTTANASQAAQIFYRDFRQFYGDGLGKHRTMPA
jgi:hypothetical protein